MGSSRGAGGRHMSLSTLAGVEMRWRKRPREILFCIKRKNSMCGKLSYGRDARWILEHSKLFRAVLWVCLWGRSCFPSYSLSLFICVSRIKSNLSLDPYSALVSTATPIWGAGGGEWGSSPWHPMGKTKPEPPHKALLGLTIGWGKLEEQMWLPWTFQLTEQERADSFKPSSHCHRQSTEQVAHNDYLCLKPPSNVKHSLTFK